MGKKYGPIDGIRIVITEITCDECKTVFKRSEKGIATHVDILTQASYEDKPHLLKTVCFTCYVNKYKKIFV